MRPLWGLTNGYWRPWSMRKISIGDYVLTGGIAGHGTHRCRQQADSGYCQRRNHIPRNPITAVCLNTHSIQDRMNSGDKKYLTYCCQETIKMYRNGEGRCPFCGQGTGDRTCLKNTRLPKKISVSLRNTAASRFMRNDTGS